MEKWSYIMRGVTLTLTLMASLEEDNLVVIHYLNASKIWPAKEVVTFGRSRGGLLWWPLVEVEGVYCDDLW